MTQEEFNNINWHRGNTAMLQNGKEYLVKGTKRHGQFLLLYSSEYDSCFLADHKIVECRTSDYEEPEEVYQEKKRQKQEAIQAKIEEERLERLKAKAERKLKNLQEQERMHLEALERKASKANSKKVARKAEDSKQEPVPTPAEKPDTTPNCTNEQPKRKRKRITISRVEKVEIK